MRHITAPILCLALSASSVFASEVTNELRVESRAVVAEGVLPNSEVLFVGVSRKPDGLYVSFETTNEVITAAADGVATLVVPDGVASQSVWAAVGLDRGSYVRISRRGTDERAATPTLHAFHRSVSTDGDLLAVNTNYAEIFVIRPGAGCWTQNASKGGELDIGKDARSMSIDLRGFKPTGRTRSSPPKTLIPGDVVVTFDIYNLRVAISVVTPQDLGAKP